MLKSIFIKNKYKNYLLLIYCKVKTLISHLLLLLSEGDLMLSRNPSAAGLLVATNELQDGLLKSDGDVGDSGLSGSWCKREMLKIRKINTKQMFRIYRSAHRISLA